MTSPDPTATTAATPAGGHPAALLAARVLLVLRRVLSAVRSAVSPTSDRSGDDTLRRIREARARSAAASARGDYTAAAREFTAALEALAEDDPDLLAGSEFNAARQLAERLEARHRELVEARSEAEELTGDLALAEERSAALEARAAALRAEAAAHRFAAAFALTPDERLWYMERARLRAAEARRLERWAAAIRSAAAAPDPTRRRRAPRCALHGTAAPIQAATAAPHAPPTASPADRCAASVAG